MTCATVPAGCGLAVKYSALAIPTRISLGAHAPKTVRDIDACCTIRAVIYCAVRNANVAFVARPTRVTSAVKTIPRWHADTVGWARVGRAGRVSMTTDCYALHSDVKTLLRVGRQIVDTTRVELYVL